MLTDFVTGKQIPKTPLENVRQEAAVYLVESLGYPKENLALDVILGDDQGKPFVADLVVMDKEEEHPIIVVSMLEPSTSLPREVPDPVIEVGAQYFFWFDGFIDYPGQPPSWGARYFERKDDGYVIVPSIPHHHRRMRPRKRRPTTKHPCPSCGERLDQFCLIPCTDDCPGWSCAWFKLLHCPTCNKSFPRSQTLRT